jgi:hypothetical protein
MDFKYEHMYLKIFRTYNVLTYLVTTSDLNSTTRGIRSTGMRNA